MPLFLTFIIFNIHSFIQYKHGFIQPSLFAEARFLYPHRFWAQQEESPWDAEPRFELGPALQLADALQYQLI